MTTPHEMDALIARHIEAENKGDIDGAVAVYAHDIEHDIVGAPGSTHGKAAARELYRQMTSSVRMDEMQVVRRYHGPAHCVIEQVYTATILAPYPGIPEGAQRVAGRMLHVFEFNNGLISRENVWVGPQQVLSGRSRTPAEEGSNS